MRKEIADNFRKSFPVEMSDEDMEEIMCALDTSFRDSAEELARTRPDDFEAIRRVTHTIIGFAGNVCAENLAAMASSLNASAHAADAQACAAGMRAIVAAWEEYRAGIPS